MRLIQSAIKRRTVVSIVVLIAALAISSLSRVTSSTTSTATTTSATVSAWASPAVTTQPTELIWRCLESLRGGTELQSDHDDRSESQTMTRTTSATKNLSESSNDTLPGSSSLVDSQQSNDFELVLSSDDDDESDSSDSDSDLMLDSSTDMTAQKLEFLDRVAAISSALKRVEKEPAVQSDHDKLLQVTYQSDLTRPGRHIHIVTTAALPWFTGTAINPLLRAAILHRRTQQVINNGKGRWVTLVVPWLELPEDQQELYGRVFDSPQAQEDYIRSWLKNDAGMPDVACKETGLDILFYPARYHSGLRSIFAMGDMLSLMDESKMDVCVLEEPEHCNWYRAPGDGWTKRFQYVVGIVHTNYKEYASSHYSGLWTAPAISLMSSAMVRAYCHKVIKLSSVLQTYAPEKEETSNVHGVRHDFLEEGQRRAREGDPKDAVGLPQVYFIGKLLWAKGLDIMLEMEDYYRQCTGEYFAIDIYGNGPDQKEIVRAFHGRNKKKKKSFVKESKKSGDLTVRSGGVDTTSEMAVDTTRSALHSKAKQRFAQIKKKIDTVDLPKSFHELRRKPIPASFPGRVDHATLKQYKVFVNPSVSEVLCTTTAEALAMGKFAIIPVHPSNKFFLKFPNCLAYRNKFEFVASLRWALTHDPEPLSPELAREFTWEAATDRFIEAAAITWEEAVAREKLGTSKLDERIAWLHNEIGKGATGDMLRKILGAGPAANQVKYASEIKRERSGNGDEHEAEDHGNGLSYKFRSSSFAEAIRATVADLSSFIQ